MASFCVSWPRLTFCGPHRLERSWLWFLLPPTFCSAMVEMGGGVEKVRRCNTSNTWNTAILEHDLVGFLNFHLMWWIRMWWCDAVMNMAWIQPQRVGKFAFVLLQAELFSRSKIFVRQSMRERTGWGHHNPLQLHVDDWPQDQGGCCARRKSGKLKLCFTKFFPDTWSKCSPPQAHFFGLFYDLCSSCRIAYIKAFSQEIIPWCASVEKLSLSGQFQ